MVFEEERFRERLRLAIKEAGGNKEVSRVSGVKLPTITSILAGSLPSIDKVVKLAAACDVELNWLVFSIEPQMEHEISPEAVELVGDAMRSSITFVLNEHIERGGAIISSSPETIADQVINIFKEVSLE